MNTPAAPQSMSTTSDVHVLPARSAAIVFLAFALAYFLSALLRAVTATLSPILSVEFNLHASDLGLLAGGYFLGFALTQLPLGQWLDRFGPKRVIVGFLSLAVLGAVAFALADRFASLLAARVLTGMGVSACLMAPLTGFRRWLSPAAQLRANAWMLMTGSLGMLAATLPVQWLMPWLGWRGLFWVLAALVVLAMLVLGVAIPRWASLSHVSTEPDVQPQAAGYAAVWRNAFFRRMAPIGFFCFGGMVAIQTLWAGPWMVRVAGYDTNASAEGLFWINASMLLTFWLWGMVNPYFVRRGLGATRLIAVGMPSSFVVLGLNIVQGPQTGWAGWAAYCVTCTFITLSQPAVGMALPSALAGRALSAYNLVIFSGVFAVQWGIGLLVDGLQALGWSVLAAYQGAMGVYLVCCVLSYVHFLTSSAVGHAPAPVRQTAGQAR